MPVPVSGTLGLGSLLDAVSASGGGGTVIPDGGTLSGTYAGSVYVDGNASLAGNVTVEGNLIVNGDLTNDGGYELTVRGYLYAQSLYFNRAITTLPQSNITVDGDMIIYGLNFVQCGGTAASLRVGGSLTGAVGFSGVFLNGSAEPDTNGLTVVVYGDVRLASVNLNGGISVNGNAGGGGALYVYGDLSLLADFTSNGGPNDNTGFSAGNGGSLVVYGNASVNTLVSMYGGDATGGGSAGNGGYFEVYGSASVNEVEMYGGGCTSNSENDRAGSGGAVEIDGSLTVRGYTNLNGGGRDGTLTAPNFLAPANGGDCTVAGNFISAGDLDSRGGYTNYSGFSGGDAGNGGSFNVRGYVYIDDLELNGGDAIGIGSAGSGGSIQIGGDFSGDDFESPGGSASISGSGGNAGASTVQGNAVIGDLYLYGGSSIGGFAGSAATLNVRGDLIVRSDFDMAGGNCDGTNDAFTAGNGGNVYCKDLNAEDSTISISSGNRTGFTTTPASNFPPTGGLLDVGGDLLCNGIDGNGCDVTCNYPNGNGGDGASIVVRGNATIRSTLSFQGGNANGNNAGSGGLFTCHGYARIGTVQGQGGNSENSPGVGGDAGVNGTGSPLFQIHGGQIGEAFLTDGTGAGTAPVGPVVATLSGPCVFDTLEMSDRIQCWIQAGTPLNGGAPALLTLRDMGGVGFKDTLNDAAGTATGSITASLGNSVFFSGTSGVWYAAAGVAL